jgi:hypothetical protein
MPSDQSPIEPPDDGNKRMSSTVKLALMGVGAAALLYSCTPTVRSMPSFWLFGNPFYRPPVTTICPPGTASCDQQATSGRTGGSGGGSGGSLRSSGSSSSGGATADAAGSGSSARGGFGSTGAANGSGGS